MSDTAVQQQAAPTKTDAPADTLPAPAPHVASQADDIDHSVIDIALYKGDARTMQFLRAQNIVKSDEAMSKLLTAKRINRAAFSQHEADDIKDKALAQDIAAVQEEFKKQAAAMPFEQLVEKGHVNNLLEGYLNALVHGHRAKLDRLDSSQITTGDERDPATFNTIHAQTEAKIAKYTSELEYYKANPDVVKNTAKEFPFVVQDAAYLPIGRIVAKSGLADTNPEVATDLVNDVLARACAHNIQQMKSFFPDPDYMKLYEASPQQYETQIQAIGERIHKASPPVGKQPAPEKQCPELDKILGLRGLLSAQLHLSTEDDVPPVTIHTLKNAQALVNDYTQVAMSLSYHYLSEGSSANDPRIKTMRAQLEEQMHKGGIPLLSAEEANAKAATLARASAEEVLMEARKKPELTEKINALAKAAGVNIEAEPLVLKQHLTASTPAAEAKAEIAPEEPAQAPAPEAPKHAGNPPAPTHLERLRAATAAASEKLFGAMR